MRISDWSSDVCSSDLQDPCRHGTGRSGHRASSKAGPLLLYGRVGQRPRTGKSPGQTGQIANRLVHSDLVILDELGYLPFSASGEIGRAQVCTPVTNAHLVCRLLLGKKKNETVTHVPRDETQ